MINHYLRHAFRQVIIGGLLALSVCVQVGADEITLNIKDADIRALISTVSKFTGKNFIIDPRVKAKITESISLQVVLQDIYDNKPVPGREENDIRLVSGVSYDF